MESRKTLDEIEDELAEVAREPEYAIDAETVQTAMTLIRELYELGLDVAVFPADEGCIDVSPRTADLFMDITIQKNDILGVELQEGIGLNYKRLEFIEHPSAAQVKRLLQSTLLCVRQPVATPLPDSRASALAESGPCRMRNTMGM